VGRQDLENEGGVCLELGQASPGWSIAEVSWGSGCFRVSRYSAGALLCSTPNMQEFTRTRERRPIGCQRVHGTGQPQRIPSGPVDRWAFHCPFVPCSSLLAFPAADDDQRRNDKQMNHILTCWARLWHKTLFPIYSAFAENGSNALSASRTR